LLGSLRLRGPGKGQLYASWQAKSKPKPLAQAC